MNYKAYTLEEATRRMERYCAYQERCHQEVRKKLREMRMIPVAIDQIIVHLLEHDFLNEQRFAEIFARSKFNQKSWGRLRIKAELKQRDISEYNTKLALRQLEESAYQDRFTHLAQKRWQQLRAETPATKRKKFVNYLQYRGWESQLIFDKLAEFDQTGAKLSSE